jgi:hypothetical protein
LAVEEVLDEGVLFDVQAGVRHLITDKTFKGGEAVYQSISQPSAPLSAPACGGLRSARSRVLLHPAILIKVRNISLNEYRYTRRS